MYNGKVRTVWHGKLWMKSWIFVGNFLGPNFADTIKMVDTLRPICVNFSSKQIENYSDIFSWCKYLLSDKFRDIKR